MLMISTIHGVNDVMYFAEKMNYKEAIKGLNSYGLKLSYLQSSPRLFTLLASEDIINQLNGRPLISYHDGIVYLTRKESDKIKLSEIYKILSKRLIGGSEDVEPFVNTIEKCIKTKEKDWRELNLSKFDILYKEGKPKQLNAFLPTKSCNYFEDVVSLLDNEGKLKVAKTIVERYKDDLPHAVITYFLEKFSKNPDNKDYIKDELGIKEKFPHYLKDMDTEKVLEGIIKALEKKYSGESKGDLTLMAFVKKSFNGDVVNDLPEIKDKPKNYCIVCGMPIYGEVTSFKQYSTQLKGKTEIWIPRETGLEEIDKVSKLWTICPVCNYEASMMKETFVSPYLIVSFYPGIAVDLLKILTYRVSQDKIVFADVIKDEVFKKIYEEAGGGLNERDRTVLPDYLGSKIVISANNLGISGRYTRLTKEVLNDILPSVPSISISFLASPVFITSNIYDFPLSSRHIEISSEYNYTWLKGLENEKVLLLALAFRAKYFALKKAVKDVNKRENYLMSMVNEMDEFTMVDPSLSVIALGIAINEESSFFNSLLPYSYFLNKVFGKVSKMGETFSKSLYSMAKTLDEIIKDKKDVSKHDIVGFFRDGIDMFFKTSSVVLDKDDRVAIAANTALNSLQNKYTLDDKHAGIMFSNLRDVFSLLYDIEERSDRSLAISISTALVNWLYLLFNSLGEENE